MQAKWIARFNAVYASAGEEAAFIVANTWLKKQIKKKESMTRTDITFERVEFVVDETTELISRTENGEEYISFKLADVFKDKLGVQLPEEVLQSWADSINSGKAVLGDVDHAHWQKLLNAGMTEEQIKAEIVKKPSIAKAVKAVFDKGRLWIQAVIDKRYKKVVQNSKGVSLEAIIKRDSQTDQVRFGELCGFTFGVKQNPVIAGTEVYA